MVLIFESILSGLLIPALLIKSYSLELHMLPGFFYLIVLTAIEKLRYSVKFEIMPFGNFVFSFSLKEKE